MMRKLLRQNRNKLLDSQLNNNFKNKSNNLTRIQSNKTYNVRIKKHKLYKRQINKI